MILLHPGFAKAAFNMSTAYYVVDSDLLPAVAASAELDQKHMLNSNEPVCVQELQEDFAFSLHRNEDLTAKLELSAQALPPFRGDNGSMQQSEEPQDTFQVSAEAPNLQLGNAAHMQSHPASELDHEAPEHQNLSPQETGLQQSLAPAELHILDAQHESPVLKSVRTRYLLPNMEVTSAF